MTFTKEVYCEGLTMLLLQVITRCNGSASKEDYQRQKDEFEHTYFFVVYSRLYTTPTPTTDETMSQPISMVDWY
ncbi:MAG: hypothetical protein M3040_11145 [Bacteroidota bacterium]|nr:hypothetical protein [Bacteroidota bacterium]